MSSASSSSSLSSSGQVGSTSVGGDGILVDLLETEVDSLKAQLEKTQNDLVNILAGVSPTFLLKN